MNYGFVKTAVVTPKIKVADVAYNGAEIEKLMKEAAQSVQIIVFPELCLTGATCGDIFRQELLLDSAKEELVRLVKLTEEVSGLVLVGLPWEHRGKLYNVAAVFDETGVVSQFCSAKSTSSVSTFVKLVAPLMYPTFNLSFDGM